jgi:hypothetical protein
MANHSEIYNGESSKIANQYFFISVDFDLKKRGRKGYK